MTERERKQNDEFSECIFTPNIGYESLQNWLKVKEKVSHEREYNIERSVKQFLERQTRAKERD